MDIRVNRLRILVCCVITHIACSLPGVVDSSRAIIEGVFGSLRRRKGSGCVVMQSFRAAAYVGYPPNCAVLVVGKQ